MGIENIRFHILSKGEDQPEILPEAGDVFELSVRSMGSLNEDTTEIATIVAESVRTLGHYGHVTGLGKVGAADNLLRAIAKYETNKNYPLGTKIGSLILKKVTNGK